MPKLSHFAINADDPESCRAFYAAVFGWRFEPWGPPGFFRVDADDPDGPGTTAAIQQRRSLVGAQRTVGFECTVGVDDLDEAIARAAEAGGWLLHGPDTIPGVGRLAWLADNSGNVVGAMQYDH